MTDTLKKDRLAVILAIIAALALTLIGVWLAWKPPAVSWPERPPPQLREESVFAADINRRMPLRGTRAVADALEALEPGQALVCREMRVSE